MPARQDVRSDAVRSALANIASRNWHKTWQNVRPVFTVVRLRIADAARRCAPSALPVAERVTTLEN